MSKKILLFTVAILALVACEDSEGGLNIIERKVLPSTEVYVQGTMINSYMTRMFEYGDKWPKSMAETEGWEAAKFSVRIDGTIPGYINQDKAKYWGGTEGPNLGKIDVSYPFGKYDDRGLDYYKIDKATGENTGLFRYVLDPTGVEVDKALIETPDVWEILEYWSAKENVQQKAKLDDIIANKNKLKVIWYVAKEVGGQYLWHVNGIITEKTTSDIFDKIKDEIEEDGMVISGIDPSKIADNVEVDIHLQEHKDWNEIKTSIHVRTDAQSVTVNIPIDYSNIVEQDDFAIRVFDYYYSGWELMNMITHDENGITIDIVDIDPDFINSLKSKFGDGVTVEVHSYCKQLDGVWEDMKKSTVTTGKPCTVSTKISTPQEIYDPSNP